MSSNQSETLNTQTEDPRRFMGETSDLDTSTRQLLGSICLAMR